MIVVLKKACLVALISMVAAAGQARAGVTVFDSTAAYTGYESNYAIDTGPNSLNTDYASYGGGASTYISFDLGAAVTTSSVSVTDRTTSGSANGAFYGGYNDKTTQFSLTFATDSLFTNVVYTNTFNSPGTGFSNSPADFLTTVSIPNVTAEYVRYNVVAANGANTGIADIQFTQVATPEPSTIATAGLGLIGGILAIARRRKARLNVA